MARDIEISRERERERERERKRECKRNIGGRGGTYSASGGHNHVNLAVALAEELLGSSLYVRQRVRRIAVLI